MCNISGPEKSTKVHSFPMLTLRKLVPPVHWGESMEDGLNSIIQFNYYFKQLVFI